MQRVKDLYQAQIELGSANETVASAYHITVVGTELTANVLQGIRSRSRKISTGFDRRRKTRSTRLKRWKLDGKSSIASRGTCTRFVYLRHYCSLFLTLRQRYSPAFLLMRLKHAVTAQDDASEARATAVVQGSSDASSDGLGGRDVDEFVKEFREMRKVYHKRAMWAERWQLGEVAWQESR
jgi:ESCRT-I complex subunit VPS37